MVRYHKLYFKKIFYGSTLNIIVNGHIRTLYPTLKNKNLFLDIREDIVWSTKKSDHLVKYGINYFHNNLYLNLFYKKKTKTYKLNLSIIQLPKIKYHKKLKKIL